MASKADKALLIITNMMLEEHDEHADLLEKIKNRYSPSPTKNHKVFLDNLNLIHDIRIELLERVYREIKEIK